MEDTQFRASLEMSKCSSVLEDEKDDDDNLAESDEEIYGGV